MNEFYYVFSFRLTDRGSCSARSKHTGEKYEVNGHMKPFSLFLVCKEDNVAKNLC